VKGNRIIAAGLALVAVLLFLQIRSLNRMADKLERLERAGGAARIPADEAAPKASWRGKVRRDVFRPEVGVPGGSLDVYVSGDIDSFNPITAKRMASFIAQIPIYESLYLLEPATLTWIPRLATRHEFSDDKLRLTMHLREGVVWSDGAPFTADDVVFTVRALLDPSVTSYSSRAFIYHVDGKDVPLEVRKIETLTVEFRQPVPNAGIIPRLFFGILPRHRTEAALAAGTLNSSLGFNTPPEEVVGTGPFLLESYERSSRVTYRRNPRFWGRDAAGRELPYLDRLVIHIVPSIEAARLSFVAGKLDILRVEGPDVPDIEAGAAAGGWEMVDCGPDMAYVYLAFNQNRDANPATGEPWVDPAKLRWYCDTRFRLAVAHTIDKRTIIDNVYGGLAAATWTPYNESCGRFHNAGVTRYEYDIDRARSLLDEIGMIDRDGDGTREDTEGKAISFRFFYAAKEGFSIKIAGIVRDGMREVGLDPRMRMVDESRLSRLIFNEHDWDAILSSDSGGAGEPSANDALWSSAGNYHVWYPNQAKPATEWERRLDEVFRLGSLEFDDVKRMAYVFEFQEIIAREAPLILIVSPLMIYADRRIGNFAPAAGAPSPIWNLPYLFRRPGGTPAEGGR